MFVKELRGGFVLGYGHHADVPDENVHEVTRGDFSEPLVLVIFSDYVRGLSIGSGPGDGVPLGAVSLMCDGELADLSATWNATYTSAGSQSLDPDVGPASLGPQLRISPDPVLKLGTTCSIELGADVVGLDGTRVCASDDGDPDTPCEPGDLSAIEFGLAPFEVVGTAPADGEEDVAVDVLPIIALNWWVDPESVASISMEDETGPVPISPRRGSDETIVYIDLDAPLSAGATYTVRIPGGEQGLRETAGGTLTEDATIEFRTAGRAAR